MKYNNMSQMITSFKLKLGLLSIATPLEDLNDFILTVLRLETLPTFSRYAPYRFDFSINADQLPCIEEGYARSKYVLPEKMFPNQRILYVFDVKQNANLPGSGYATSIYAATMDTYAGAMLSQINANLISSIAPPFTFEFEDPNILTLYNMSCLLGNMQITLGLTHSENFTTIKATQWDSFEELAILDIKAALYETLKQYEDLSTSYANIQLKIDDWQNARDKREDLIEKWKDVYHLDMPGYLII